MQYVHRSAHTHDMRPYHVTCNSTSRVCIDIWRGLTGVLGAKVCVPVDPSAAFEFDPEGVPTVWQLLDEAGQLPAPQDASAGDPELPSLAGSLHLFQQGFLQDLQVANKDSLNAAAKEAAQKSALSW